MHKSILRRQTRFIFMLLCLGVLFAENGCYEVDYGRYEATEVTDWKVFQHAGGYFFFYPTTDVPAWHIGITGTHQGKIHLGFGSNAYGSGGIWRLVHFSDRPIELRFHDKNKDVFIQSDNFRTPIGETLDVGDSQDFSVVVPSFKIGVNTIPDLSIHLRWSDKKYYVWKPL